jgi:predicted Abi (CAAX) family protease
LALFVGMHPVNGYFFHRRELELFVNHTFLSLSLLLGIVCTAAYVMTGSLWPSVLMHWAAVTVWIELLGGAQWLGISVLR